MPTPCTALFPSLPGSRHPDPRRHRVWVRRADPQEERAVSVLARARFCSPDHFRAGARPARGSAEVWTPLRVRAAPMGLPWHRGAPWRATAPAPPPTARKPPGNIGSGCDALRHWWAWTPPPLRRACRGARRRSTRAVPAPMISKSIDRIHDSADQRRNHRESARR